MKKLIALLALVAFPLMASALDARPATVVDLAASNPDFSTLVTAVQTADLVDTLSSGGTFEVETVIDAVLLPPTV